MVAHVTVANNSHMLSNGDVYIKW